jgi:mannose-6-phosphate isomerase-like protein (cupin superfamily)
MNNSLEKDNNKTFRRNATGIFTAKLGDEDLALTEQFIESLSTYFAFGGSKRVNNIKINVQFLIPPNPVEHNEYGPAELKLAIFIITENYADGRSVQTRYVPIDGRVGFHYELKEKYYFIKGDYKFEIQNEKLSSKPGILLTGEFDLKAREYVLPRP